MADEPDYMGDEIFPDGEFEDPDAAQPGAVVEDGTSELEWEVRSLQEAIQEAQREIAALRVSVEESDARIDRMLSQWTRHRDDLDSLQSEGHRLLAEKYVGFVEQALFGLARKSVALHPKEDSGDAISRTVQKLCLEIFGRADASEVRLRRIVKARSTDALASHVSNVFHQGIALLREARSMRARGYWDFECSEGELVEADRHQVWGKSDPDGLVRYVVAPAYMANGVRYCLQRVVTVERA
ncbi:DUF6468 domain-containing protein [Streptomyces sp. 2224.1]|uniref:DUF6468 domain-containing protein n=1 Tax=Streptomyces sp. 2224.1 TaxID=1881020 RepID=UPI001160CCDC|nr:DUF6468 domain-containing protein [Streptomyces sp. 2224.1]